MIEESCKSDNQEFGQNIVKAVNSIARENRHRNDAGGQIKKDFLLEHNRKVKNWKDERRSDQTSQQSRSLEKRENAVKKKKQTLNEHSKKMHNWLIKWDEYRKRRELLCQLQHAAINKLAMKRAWAYIICVESVFK